MVLAEASHRLRKRWAEQDDPSPVEIKQSHINQTKLFVFSRAGQNTGFYLKQAGPPTATVLLKSSVELRQLVTVGQHWRPGFHV